jgi:hypothetical protein
MNSTTPRAAQIIGQTQRIIEFSFCLTPILGVGGGGKFNLNEPVGPPGDRSSVSCRLPGQPREARSLKAESRTAHPPVVRWPGTTDWGGWALGFVSVFGLRFLVGQLGGLQEAELRPGLFRPSITA